jgi:hypothetical protein
MKIVFFFCFFEQSRFSSLKTILIPEKDLGRGTFPRAVLRSSKIFGNQPEILLHPNITHFPKYNMQNETRYLFKLYIIYLISRRLLS